MPNARIRMCRCGPLGLLGGEKPEADLLGNEGMIDHQWQKILPPDQIETTVADMCE